MKILAIMEKPDDLEILKARVKQGTEEIFTIIDGKTVFLEYNSIENVFTKRIVSKRELTALTANFQATEIETETETPNKNEIDEKTDAETITVTNPEQCVADAATEPTGNATSGKWHEIEQTLTKLETRLTTIEEALYRPITILAKSL